MDYFKFGHGRETLVILPGLSMQSVMLYADAVADAYKPLTDDFTVYVFDRRKELPASYSVYETARDTAEAARKLALGRVSIFGASQGGMIAMVLAAEHPEMINKLILGSTSARVTEFSARTVEKWIDLAKAHDAAGLYLAFGEAVYPRGVYIQSRETLLEAAKTVTDNDLDRFIILAKGIKRFDVTDSLHKIACPVLIIGSKDDGVLGADAAEDTAAYFSGRQDVELYMYDGFGHAAYDTAPDYKERMLRFLLTGRSLFADVKTE